MVLAPLKPITLFEGLGLPFDFKFLNLIQNRAVGYVQAIPLRGKRGGLPQQVGISQADFNKIFNEQEEESKKRLLGFIRSKPFLEKASFFDEIENNEGAVLVNNFFNEQRGSLRTASRQLFDFQIGQENAQRSFMAKREVLKERFDIWKSLNNGKYLKNNG